MKKEYFWAGVFSTLLSLYSVRSLLNPSVRYPLIVQAFGDINWVVQGAIDGFSGAQRPSVPIEIAPAKPVPPNAKKAP